MTVNDVITLIEEIAHPALQESYDNAGLNVGNPQTLVSGVLCTLDVTPEVLQEAIDLNANLILAHHPIIFQGLKSLTGKDDTEKIVIKAIQNNISIYSGHTNMDNVMQGVNTKICEKLNLQDCRILAPIKDNLLKLVTFVPKEFSEKVRSALFDAGAGQVGNYDCCSFNSTGEGSFRALEGTNPFVGERYKLHFEKETRVEVILPKHLKKNVLTALLATHPYEEVAYDLFLLANENPSVGAGMIGTLKETTTLHNLLTSLKDDFFAEGIRYTGDINKKVQTIAVCGGSGAFLISQAKRNKADAFITGDIKYHQFFEGNEQLSLIDIGHYESEQFTKNIFYEAVMKKMPTFAVHLSKVTTTAVKYFK